MTLKEIVSEYSQWYDSLREIMGEDESRYTDQIGDILRSGRTLTDFSDLDGKVSSNGAPTFNTYPFGQRTKDIFPLLVAACDNTRSLRSVFKHMQKHIENYYFCNSTKDDCTVVLLTTVWDQAIFEPFELPFFLMCLQYNVRLKMILVTDYGVTEIPFAEVVQRIKRSGNTAETVHGLKAEMAKREQIDRFAARIAMSGKPVKFQICGGTWNLQAISVWTVDMHSRKCERILNGIAKPVSSGGIRVEGGQRQTKQLTSPEIKKFLASISFVEDWDNANFRHCQIFDVGEWTLEMPYEVYFGMEGDENCEKLENCFNRLMA